MMTLGDDLRKRTDAGDEYYRRMLRKIVDDRVYECIVPELEAIATQGRTKTIIRFDNTLLSRCPIFTVDGRQVKIKLDTYETSGELHEAERNLFSSGREFDCLLARHAGDILTTLGKRLQEEGLRTEFHNGLTGHHPSLRVEW